MEKAGLIAGIVGFLLLIAGVSAIHWPAGLIVAGLGLLGWSALVARSLARSAEMARIQAERNARNEAG